MAAPMSTPPPIGSCGSVVLDLKLDLEAESWKLPSSRFKGVVPWSNGRWGAQIYENHKRIWLGTFNEEDEVVQRRSPAVKRAMGCLDLRESQAHVAREFYGRRRGHKSVRHRYAMLSRRQRGSRPEIMFESGVKETAIFQVQGVSTQSNGRWGAQIYEKHKRVWLGNFNEEEDAARAYDTVMKLFRGTDTVTNFKPFLLSRRRLLY
ncbi:hypothetical protein L1987_71575 [Smallanthus sonchifolius]|uniref:Uncharacterized protein n=1 Tax=Smallanthus sonchifolius TaxID=185202 RepID=A0ACB9AX50_9ASTR|nr:hypothetical protein L1987_71575 [Smallanthus sonchifolius]